MSRCQWRVEDGKRCTRYEAKKRGRCQAHGRWVTCGFGIHTSCPICAEAKRAQEQAESNREAARWAGLSATEQALEIKAKRDLAIRLQQEATEAAQRESAARRSELITAGKLAKCPQCGHEVPAARVSPNANIVLSHDAPRGWDDPHYDCTGVGETVEPLKS
jgi:hypothetical protein